MRLRGLSASVGRLHLQGQQRAPAQAAAVVVGVLACQPACRRACVAPCKRPACATCLPASRLSWRLGLHLPARLVVCASRVALSLARRSCCCAEDPAAAEQRRRDEERERDQQEKEAFEQRLKEKEEVGVVQWIVQWFYEWIMQSFSMHHQRCGSIRMHATDASPQRTAAREAGCSAGTATASSLQLPCTAGRARLRRAVGQGMSLLPALSNHATPLATPLWPLGQARTRKLAEKRIPKAELEELERRRAAEEADDRKGMVQTMRWVQQGAAAVGGTYAVSGRLLPAAVAAAAAARRGCPQRARRPLATPVMVAGGAWPSSRAAQPRRLPQSTPKGVFFLPFFLTPRDTLLPAPQRHLPPGVPEEARGGQAGGAQGGAGGREVPIPGGGPSEHGRGSRCTRARCVDL